MMYQLCYWLGPGVLPGWYHREIGEPPVLERLGSIEMPLVLEQPTQLYISVESQEVRTVED